MLWYIQINDGICTVEGGLVDFKQIREKIGSGVAAENLNDNGANLAGKDRGV